ncbi:putative WD40-repeat-containing domain superfamily [Plasmopara halstedii]
MLVSVHLLIGLYGVFYCSFVYGGSDIEIVLDTDGFVAVDNRVADSVDSRVHVSEETDFDLKRVRENIKIDDVVKSNEDSVITMLQRELATVDQMIKLQEKKLQVLQKMRSLWLHEQEAQLHQDVEELKKESANVVEFIEQKLNDVIGETEAVSTFDTYFVEKASITMETEVIGMTSTVMGTMHLIALAYKNGFIVFYTSRMKEMVRLDTKMRMVEQIFLEWQDDQPCLVVTFETSEIGIYELQLTDKNGSVGDNQEPMVTYAGEPEFLLSVSRFRNYQLPYKVSGLSITRSSRQLILAVAQIDGTIDFRALNGTSLHKFQTNASISVVEINRNRLAFSDMANVVITILTRAHSPVFYTCPGSSANVESIAFDVLQPDIIYVGTQRGEILVYAIAGTTSEVLACRLLSRSFVTKSTEYKAPVLLVTTEAYVIAAEKDEIVVFNISRILQNGISLVQLCSIRLRKPLYMTQGDLNKFPRMMYSEENSGSYLTIISRNKEGQDMLTIYYSLLPKERDTLDYQWTLYLPGIVIVIAVVGAQVFLKWKKPANVNPWTLKYDSVSSRYMKYKDRKYPDHNSEYHRDYPSHTSEFEQYATGKSSLTLIINRQPSCFDQKRIQRSHLSKGAQIAGRVLTITLKCPIMRKVRVVVVPKKVDTSKRIDNGTKSETKQEFIGWIPFDYLVNQLKDDVSRYWQCDPFKYDLCDELGNVLQDNKVLELAHFHPATLQLRQNECQPPSAIRKAMKTSEYFRMYDQLFNLFVFHALQNRQRCSLRITSYQFKILLQKSTARTIFQQEKKLVFDQRVALAFQAAQSNVNNNGNASAGINFDEFLDALMDVAFFMHPDTATKEQSFENLVIDFIIPFYSKDQLAPGSESLSWDQMDEILESNKVKLIAQQFSKTIQCLATSYSLDVGFAHRRSVLGYQEFQRFLREVIPTTVPITSTEVCRLFMHHCRRRQDQKEEYPEFQLVKKESIAAIYCRSLKSYPLEIKCENMIDVLGHIALLAIPRLAKAMKSSIFNFCDVNFKNKLGILSLKTLLHHISDNLKAEKSIFVKKNNDFDQARALFLLKFRKMHREDALVDYQSSYSLCWHILTVKLHYYETCKRYPSIRAQLSHGNQRCL